MHGKVLPIQVRLRGGREIRGGPGRRGHAPEGRLEAADDDGGEYRDGDGEVLRLEQAVEASEGESFFKVVLILI